MEITVTEGTPRKLVAVLGVTNEGFFYRSINGKIFYINSDQPIVEEPEGSRLEDYLQPNIGRKPVYEGDSITIQF